MASKDTLVAPSEESSVYCPSSSDERSENIEWVETDSSIQESSDDNDDDDDDEAFQWEELSGESSSSSASSWDDAEEMRYASTRSRRRISNRRSRMSTLRSASRGVISRKRRAASRKNEIATSRSVSHQKNQDDDYDDDGDDDDDENYDDDDDDENYDDDDDDDVDVDVDDDNDNDNDSTEFSGREEMSASKNAPYHSSNVGDDEAMKSLCRTATNGNEMTAPSKTSHQNNNADGDRTPPGSNEIAASRNVPPQNSNSDVEETTEFVNLTATNNCKMTAKSTSCQNNNADDEDTTAFVDGKATRKCTSTNEQSKQKTSKIGPPYSVVAIDIEIKNSRSKEDISGSKKAATVSAPFHAFAKIRHPSQPSNIPADNVGRSHNGAHCQIPFLPGLGAFLQQASSQQTYSLIQNMNLSKPAGTSEGVYQNSYSNHQNQPKSNQYSTLASSFQIRYNAELVRLGREQQHQKQQHHNPWYNYQKQVCHYQQQQNRNQFNQRLCQYQRQQQQRQDQSQYDQRRYDYQQKIQQTQNQKKYDQLCYQYYQQQLNQKQNNQHQQPQRQQQLNRNLVHQAELKRNGDRRNINRFNAFHAQHVPKLPNGKHTSSSVAPNAKASIALNNPSEIAGQNLNSDKVQVKKRKTMDEHKKEGIFRADDDQAKTKKSKVSELKTAVSVINSAPIDF